MAVAVSLCVSVAAHSVRAEVPSSVAKLVDAWDTQRNLPDVIRISFLSASRPPNVELEYSEFSDLLAACAIETPEGLDQFAKSLDSTLALGKPGYTVCEIVTSGTSERADVVFDGQTRTSISHEGKQIRLRPENRQAHVFQRGQSPVKQKSVDDLRYIPSIKDWAGYEVTELAGGNIRISKATDRMKRTIDVSLSDGAVLSERWDVKHGNRTVSKVVFQGPGVEGLDFFFPKYRVNATFLDDQLADFRVYVVDSLAVDAVVMDEEFAAKAEAGTLVIDHTNNVENPALVLLEERTPDLASSLPQIIPPKTSVTPVSSGGVVIIWLFFGAVLLIAVLAALWARSSKAS